MHNLKKNECYQNRFDILIRSLIKLITKKKRKSGQSVFLDFLKKTHPWL